jgi:hypothetical protein
VSFRKHGLLSLAFLLPLFVYSQTMSGVWALDTIYTIDSAEMVIAAHTLGIDHPPGHPLYLILAHLFSLLPFSIPDVGVILTSAIFGALSSLFLALALAERLGDRLAAVATGCCLAFGYIFWIHAAIAEVYTVQWTFLGLFLFLAMRWLNTRDDRILYLLFFALGLGATTNILLTGLITPAVILLIVRSGILLEDNTWQTGRLFKAVLAGLLGLTPFLYIPLRLTQEAGFISDFVYLNGYELQSPRWYWWYLSAEEFTGSKLFDTPLSQYPSLVVTYLYAYAHNLSTAGSVLSIIGIVMTMISLLLGFRERRETQEHSSRQDRRRAQARSRRIRSREEQPLFLQRLCTVTASPHRLFDSVLLLAFITTLLPVLSYQVPDKDVFFMPSFFFLTGFMGLALSRANSTVKGMLPSVIGKYLPWCISASIPVFLLANNFQIITEVTHNRTTYDQRLERFKSLPENAIIIGEDDGHATRFKYYQIVRNLRPDIDIHTLGRLAPRFRGELDLGRMAGLPGDLGVGLNVADRLRSLKDLVAENSGRQIYAVLDDRMPPEFDHFRTVRSSLDPYLLKVEVKPEAIESLTPLPITASSDDGYFSDLRFVGFDISGLDKGISKAFGSSLTLGNKPIDGIIKRGEIFELSFLVQRTGKKGPKYFAEFAFVNDKMQIPSAHDFSASKHLEIIPEELPVGSYRKDQFIFKIPGFIAGGHYTLAAKVNRTTGRTRGTYRGKPIHTLAPVETLKPWKGQRLYQPLGNIWIE